MASLKRMMWTSVAIAVALTMGEASSAFAQAAPAAAPAQDGSGPGAGGAAAPGGGRGRGAVQLYTPAAGAKDLKSVLFNWAWYMGMLRSSEEYDVLMTLEYMGKRTMQVNGQPC